MKVINGAKVKTHAPQEFREKGEESLTLKTTDQIRAEYYRPSLLTTSYPFFTSVV